MKKGTILFDDILTTIGEDAFKNCENLTSITLPKKVNGILANAFQNCVNLNEINYNGNSSDFKKIKFEANWNDNIPAEYANCNDSKVRIKYNYLTFTALEDNCSIGFYNNPDSSVNPTVKYSFDKSNWNTLTEEYVSVPSGSNLYCRGLNPNGISGGYDEIGYNYFTGEGKFNVSGDIMSIIDYETMPETMVGTFYNLFGGNIDTSRDNFVDIVDASNLILSAKTLTDDCYQRMFSACTSMVYGPQIKAEVLAPYCCWGMFIECTSLTTVPELPATTLADRCYQSMFSYCTSLTTAPELPATTLAEHCYYDMFGNCTSLTTVPKVLPATTLAEHCYQNMFSDCTSLTTAPELPATTLADRCYMYMFRYCTSLTTAPELPATTLAKYCYYEMFYGCSSLTTAPVLPATELAEGCYYEMFYNCTSLNYIKCLATDISATNCTYNWVPGISSTGTFIKHPDMNDWTTGVNGIPIGWIVEDAEIEYQLVDLGLPSGLKWADRNVGAYDPEDSGLYFQWGDTVGYTADQVGVDKVFNWDNYFDTTDGGNTFNKYNNNGGLTVLESMNDAATVNMGSQYRMPTIDEINELINNTTQTFIDVDGNEYDKQYVYENEPIESGNLKGVRFTGSNGNSIFIPAAGYCSESLLYVIGMYGRLWSSSLYSGNGDSARFLYFDYDGYVDEDGSYRCYGRSVRGVEFIPNSN